MISLTDGSQIGVASQGLPFSSCFVSLSPPPPPCLTNYSVTSSVTVVSSSVALAVSLTPLLSLPSLS